MKETKPITKSTRAGNCYSIPNGIDIDNFYNLIYEIIELVTKKGLTIRQAQYLFKACEDYVLESKLL